MSKNITFKSYFNFIIEPDYNRIEGLLFFDKLKHLLKLYLLTLLVLVTIGVLNEILIRIGAYSDYSQEINDAPHIFEKSYLNIYLLVGLIFVPIIEEMGFRLLLGKYNRLLINISVSLIIGIILNRLFCLKLWYPQSPFIRNIAFYIYPIIFATPIFLVLSSIKKSFSHFWNRNFKLIFYVITAMFAVLHILTLKGITIKHFYFFPIVLSPFFVHGLALGYTRIKLGIWYSVLLHFFINAPLIVKLLVVG